MTARLHHYMPQCYLKGFAKYRDKPKLFVVDAKERSAFRTSPANVAAERDFHRIDVDGIAPDAIENAFSAFEGELSQALARVIKSRSISQKDDRARLFNLIGLMSIKNPRLRETIRDFHERTAKQIMALVTATPERWASQMQKAKDAGFVGADKDLSYEEARKFVEEGKYRVNVLAARHLELELKTFDSILPLIFRRNWLLLKAPAKSTGFITSDHPSCLMWSDLKIRRGFYPPGLGLGGTQVLFPISNELAAMGAFEAEEGEMEADERLIAEVNGAIIVNSRRQIYARDDDFAYILQHNRKIMRGRDLLRDRARRPVCK
jgi:hypothetical protein